MPKLLKKERTQFVQVYVKPENEKYLDVEKTERGHSRSLIVDLALDEIRCGRFKLKVVKQIGVVEAARLKRVHKQKEIVRRQKDSARRAAKKAAKK